MREFSSILNTKIVQIIEDSEYKQNALTLTIDSSLVKDRPLSLVDMVIRLMLEDINLKIDYLITFNTGDFIDLCHKRGIGLISE